MAFVQFGARLSVALIFFLSISTQALVEQQLERDYELYLEQKSHKLKCVVGRQGNSLSSPPCIHQLQQRRLAVPLCSGGG